MGLLNAEVALILEHTLNKQQSEGQQPNAVFMKAFEYVNKTKQFQDREAVQTVRTDLERVTGLQEFEIAQLGNLCPDDAEEAKTLIPSLQLTQLPQKTRHVNSEELTDALQKMGDSKHFS